MVTITSLKSTISQVLHTSKVAKVLELGIIVFGIMNLRSCSSKIYGLEVF